MIYQQGTAAASRAAFFSRLRRPLIFPLFLIRSLPAAWFSGIRLVKVTEEEATASVPYGWRTRNPFGSTYFACLSMAAELTTGVLAMAATQGFRVSMLLTATEGQFFKKAVGTTFFTCKEGALIREAVRLAIETKEPQTVTATSTGIDGSGTGIASFRFTWSFKAKETKH